jgi:dTDP-4-amino-4,6-dideoxygalactose transaminase
MTEPRVPSKDYAAQYRALLPDLLPELERVFLEEEPVLGRPVAAFENAFADYVGAARTVAVGSGTDALFLALRALGIGPGDEVITAANTFIATVTAIAMAGARPVLVDPDEHTMNLSADGVRAAVTPATRAVIAVHLYGMPCDLAGISAVAAGHGVHLIEDAAQAHGARCADGSAAGGVGVAGCFSFHPSKNLGAFGDGGAVTTSDTALADRLLPLRNLGKTSKYTVGSLAPNSKLDTVQAVILRLKLRHLDAWVEARNAHAALYRDALADCPGLELPPPAPPGGRHAYHLFVVRLVDPARREELRNALAQRGIKTSLHYPIPPHLQDLDRDLGYRRGDLPVTERLADRVLSLPVSHELDADRIRSVCDAVRECLA